MIRLRQIAFATRDLPAAERGLVEVLDVERCYQDPNLVVFGLENALFPVGDQLLEIVTAVREDTTAGRQLDKRGGDCGYTAIFQVDDLGPVEARLTELGVRVVFDADAGDIRGLHLHRKDVPGAIVSIDAAREPAEWPWAGPVWRDHVCTGLVHGERGDDRQRPLVPRCRGALGSGPRHHARPLRRAAPRRRDGAVRGIDGRGRRGHQPHRRRDAGGRPRRRGA